MHGVTMKFMYEVYYVYIFINLRAFISCSYHIKGGNVYFIIVIS